MRAPEAETTARDALIRFGLDPRSLIRFIKYRENHVFRVDAPAGDSYALRLHRPGYRTPMEVAAEIEHLERLAAAGIGAPVPLRTPEGAALSRIACWDGQDRLVTVQHWFHNAREIGDSHAIFRGGAAPDTALLRELGRLSARQHVLAETLSPTQNIDRPAWDREGLAGARPLWGDAASLRSLSIEDARMLRAAQSAIYRDLASAPTDRRHYGIIHADLTCENVLTCPAAPGESEMIVIDFDDFGSGWYLFDLATVLFFLGPHPEYPRCAEAVFAGYREVRPLQQSELDLWEPLLLARGLTYLGWAVDRPGDPASDFAEQHLAPWVVRHAQRYLEERESA